MSYFEAKMRQISISVAPDSAEGANSAPPNLLAGFKGSYFYGKGRERKGKGEGRDKWRGRGLEPPPIQIFSYATGSWDMDGSPLLVSFRTLSSIISSQHGRSHRP